MTVSARQGYESATLWLRLFPQRLHLDLVQTNRLGAVVLDLQRVLLLVERQLGRDGILSFSLAVLVDDDLHERERIVDGPRLVPRLPEADVAIEGEDDLLLALGERRVPRVAQVPSELRLMRIRPHPAREAEAALRAHLLDLLQQRVLSFREHRLDQALAL